MGRATPLTLEEANAVIERTGGWEALQASMSRAEQSQDALARYMRSTPFSEEQRWVAAHGSVVYTAATLEQLTSKIEAAGIPFNDTVCQQRLPPGTRLVLPALICLD